MMPRFKSEKADSTGKKETEIVIGIRQRGGDLFTMTRAGVPASKHKTIPTKEKVYVRGDIHTNTRLGYIKAVERFLSNHLRSQV